MSARPARPRRLHEETLALLARSADNRRRTLALSITVAVLIAAAVLVVGSLLGQWILGLVAGSTAATVAVLLSLKTTVAVVTRSLGAEPADSHRHAGPLNLIESLCVAGGLPRPALYVVDDPGCNALVVGTNARRSALVVTSGLLATLTRVELEGILAREISLIRSGDAALASTAFALVGRPGWALAGLGGGRLSALADRLVAGNVGSDRDLRADFCGVGLTRYPPGLAAALEKVEGNSEVKRALPSTFILWCANPSPRTAGAGPLPLGDRPLDVHQTLAARIQALHEM